MYLGLLAQRNALLGVSPTPEGVNEFPSNFNQVGWDLTVSLTEEMLSKMKKLQSIKGKRLTPQFYGSIYNRAKIAIRELDKQIEGLETSGVDYAAECMNLISEIAALQAVKATEPAPESAGEAAEPAADPAPEIAGSAGSGEETAPDIEDLGDAIALAGTITPESETVGRRGNRN